MDSRQIGITNASANNNPVYEDFEPPFEWDRSQEAVDTLIVFLPGLVFLSLYIYVQLFFMLAVEFYEGEPISVFSNK